MDGRVDLWNFIFTRFLPALAAGLFTYYIYNFIFVRPKMNRIKKQETLIKSLVVGDEVITVGGIVGTITELDAETAYLDVGNDVILRIMRPGIGQRFEHYESDPAAVDEWIDDDEESQ
jgi:preprotein translocase subunit YajC